MYQALCDPLPQNLPQVARTLFQIQANNMSQIKKTNKGQGWNFEQIWQVMYHFQDLNIFINLDRCMFFNLKNNFPDSITMLGQCWHNVPLRWQTMLAQRNFVRTANAGPTYILLTVASMLGQHLYDICPTFKFGHNCQFLFLNIG